MHERIFLDGVTISGLRDRLAAITPDILEILVPNGVATFHEETFDEDPPNHGYLLKVDQRSWKGDIIEANLRLEEHWARKGGVEGAPPERLDSVWMSYRIVRGSIWLAELWSSIHVDDPTDPVLSFTLQENTRVLDEALWQWVVDVLRRIPGRIAMEDAPYFVRTTRNKTLYNTDLILRDASGTVVGFTTREGRDAAILCQGRIYWEAEYAGIVADESFDDFLARTQTTASGEEANLRIDLAEIVAAVHKLRGMGQT